MTEIYKHNIQSLFTVPKKKKRNKKRTGLRLVERVFFFRHSFEQYFEQTSWLKNCICSRIPNKSVFKQDTRYLIQTQGDYKVTTRITLTRTSVRSTFVCHSWLNYPKDSLFITQVFRPKWFIIPFCAGRCRPPIQYVILTSHYIVCLRIWLRHPDHVHSLGQLGRLLLSSFLFWVRFTKWFQSSK